MLRVEWLWPVEMIIPDTDRRISLWWTLTWLKVQLRISKGTKFHRMSYKICQWYWTIISKNREWLPKNSDLTCTSMIQKRWTSKKLWNKCKVLQEQSPQREWDLPVEKRRNDLLFYKKKEFPFFINDSCL